MSTQPSNLALASRDFPISRWLSEHADVVDHGGKYIYLDCPVCGGRKKLIVRRESKRASCYRCSDGGHGGDTWNGEANLLELICLIEGCSKREAVQRIFELAEWPDTTPLQHTSRPRRIIPRDAIPLTKVRKDHPAQKVLRERQLQHLEDRLYMCPDGDYADRWILPCMYFGELQGFEAKTYRGGNPKSLFPKDWFSTQDTIYTTYQWDMATTFVVITESIFDAETFGCNTIGIYGSHLHPGQLLRLFELKAKGITKLVWCLDEDAWKKQRQSILSSTAMWFDNYVCRLPKGTDPNELGRKRCWDLVAKSSQVNSEVDLLYSEIPTLL